MASGKTQAPETLNMLTLLQRHRRGEILAEADVALQDVIAAITEHGGKGKVTLTLNLKMEKGQQISLTPDLRFEKPRRPMATGIYFATDDNQLTRNDPQQDWVADDVARRRAGDRDDD